MEARSCFASRLVSDCLIVDMEAWQEGIGCVCDYVGMLEDGGGEDVLLSSFKPCLQAFLMNQETMVLLSS